MQIRSFTHLIMYLVNRPINQSTNQPTNHFNEFLNDTNNQESSEQTECTPFSLVGFFLVDGQVEIVLS